jgi:methylmalonyl-CoA mutase
VVRLIQRAGYDLVIVETSGIGQGDAEITRLADLCLYVMTAEYGAPSQLEKIEMLDLARVDRDQQVRAQGQQGRAARRPQAGPAQPRDPVQRADEALPVFGTVASRFHDSGVNGLYAAVCDGLTPVSRAPWRCHIPREQRALASDTRDLIPPERTRYLARSSAPSTTTRPARAARSRRSGS